MQAGIRTSHQMKHTIRDLCWNMFQLFHLQQFDDPGCSDNYLSTGRDTVDSPEVRGSTLGSAAAGSDRPRPRRLFGVCALAMLRNPPRWVHFPWPRGASQRPKKEVAMACHGAYHGARGLRAEGCAFHGLCRTVPLGSLNRPVACSVRLGPFRSA